MHVAGVAAEHPRPDSSYDVDAAGMVSSSKGLQSTWDLAPSRALPPPAHTDHAPVHLLLAQAAGRGMLQGRQAAEVGCDITGDHASETTGAGGCRLMEKLVCSPSVSYSMHVRE